MAARPNDTVPAIPAGAFALIAELRAKTGREDELRAITAPLVAPARAEPDTLVFFLHEDLDAPGHFILYEVYTSRAAHAAHVAQARVQAWFARLPELTEGGVRVVHMRFFCDPG
jgi:quinol monooxygenase YgiN